MAYKVTNLSIQPQTGSSGIYFASWNFSIPNITTASNTIKKGTLVRITGTKYYNGVKIPDWVKKDTWYIVQVKNKRAVLGKNASGTHDIQSPINVNSIAAVNTTSSSTISVKNLDHYTVKWYYATGDGVLFDGGSSDVTVKNATYSPPSNATKIKVSVTPVSKKHKVNDKEVSYWTGKAVTKEYSIKNSPPETPSVPKVTIENLKLTASIDNISDARTDQVEFRVYKRNSTFTTGVADVKTARVSFSCAITNGSDYRVKCRAINLVGSSKVYSDWSEYSESAGTAPATPSGFVTVKALSTTSVYLDWVNVESATQYEVQYTEQKRYFDSSSEVKSLTVEAVVGHAEVTGLETGKEWFFRVRAINDSGESGWTEIVSVIIGKKPAPPTTWSSTTTAIVGESLTLYWVHNSEDGSSQTYAILEILANGVNISGSPFTIKNTTNESDKDKTSSYTIDTSGFTEGTTLQWRVKTKGVFDEYGDWSVQRTVDVYAKPTLQINLTNSEGAELETITSFPFCIKGIAGPSTQSPIGYSITIVSNERYETVDDIGNEKIVNKDEVIYSKYFDTTNQLLVEFSPSNIDLENGIMYTVTGTVSMNSGLTAESSLNFTVSWEDDIYEPDAGVTIDNDLLVAYIRPFCTATRDEDDELIDNVLLSVYRREFDGTFTELGSEISNTMNTTITDPHPALDYARYRVVATSNTTGAVSYYDVPGYPVSEKSVVIQWAEQWSHFEVVNEDELEEPPWSGSMLKIPYNIDVSDDHKPDASLVKYIGRERPVSYYGTQLGETSTWNMEIPKHDTDTLYALRRLARYMGDVYVREPSGSGYWANITISYSQTHQKLTIPITINITRVEGGV